MAGLWKPLEKTFAGSRQMLADELFQKLIEVS